jgi:hypothetical protein
MRWASPFRGSGSRGLCGGTVSSAEMDRGGIEWQLATLKPGGSWTMTTSITTTTWHGC